MTINERFFKLLDEKKVSQKDFCEATGIPKQTVSGWKNRKTDPPASLIPTIAASLGSHLTFCLPGKMNAIRQILNLMTHLLSNS